MRITKRQLRGIIRESLSEVQRPWGTYAQKGSNYWSDVIVMSPNGDSVLVDGLETYVRDVPRQLEAWSGFPVDAAFAEELVAELKNQMRSGYVEVGVTVENGVWRI